MTELPRARWVVGNWKMNPLSPEEAHLLARRCDEACHGSVVKVGLCPGFLHLAAVSGMVSEGALKVMAQDVASISGLGAYTGEVSAEQLVTAGVTGVLVGHSERRLHQAESEPLLYAKTHAAFAAGLQVIFCVGESWADRQAGRAEQVVLNQLQRLRDGILPQYWPQWLIAYEPIWAIGTGQVASADDAQAMHAVIRGFLRERDPALQKTPILYGGSVKPDNAASLAACADVDGALVGGASLDAEAFAAIVAAFA